MRNTFVWGFNSKSAASIINLLDNKKIIDIKVWVGTAKDSTHDMISFFVGDFAKDSYNGNASVIYKDISSNTISKYMDMMSRHSFHSEKSFHDYVNIYNLQYDMFSDLLIKNEIEVVLFSNLPHEGPDLLLYEIAKKMNLKTILFYQSLFPNRFFYMYDLDDFGTFKEAKKVTHNLKVKCEKKYEKKLFYMDNIKKHNRNFFSLARGTFIESVLYHGSFFLKKKTYINLKEVTNRRLNHNIHEKHSVPNFNNLDQSTVKILTDSKKNKGKSSYIFSSLRSMSLRFVQRYINYRQAKKNFAKLISKDIDLDVKFVYFPLHLQPELTTSAIAGIYVDQLLAIERLSKIIPDGWQIYVKENPKQTELMRGKWFYERLKLIEKVKVTPLDYNTYLLIEKCCFVATITGTVGWEAISGGKNALIFGDAWYKSLPGVFSYEDNFEFDKLLNYKVEHCELEESLNALLSKTGEGVIDDAYSNLVDDFDIDDNALKVATLIESLLIN